MSKVAQARRPSASGSSARTGVSRVQARARPGAGRGAANHRRQGRDNLERQADEIASRIMRGEKNLAHRITPTSPAGLPTASSSGRPLPRRLREDLEGAFDADLRAVRIHTGTSADRTARRFDALAIASGRNIYFRDGLYSPGTSAGRELLTHELTHVLQQTGRLTTDGRLRVTDLHGYSEPQAKRTCPLASSTTIPDFDQMAERHRTAAPTDKLLTAKIAQIKRERDAAIAANRLENYWDTLDSYVRSHPDEYNELVAPATVRAFIYDCLKLAKRWDGAAFLLARDWDLQTTFFASEVYEAFPEGAVSGATNNLTYDDFAYGFWEVHPFYEKFRAKRFLEATRDYLVGPSRAVQDLDAQSGEFAKLVDAKLGERDAPSALIYNELFFVGLHVVREVDKIRIKKTAEFAHGVAGGKPLTALTPQERALTADKLAVWARGLPLDKTYTGEISALLSRLSTALADTAEAAKNFWNVAGSIVDFAAQGVILPQIGDARAGLAAFGKRPEVEGFRDRLIAGAKELFKVDAEGNPPSPADYATARDAFIAKVTEKLFERFEQPMLQAIRSTKEEDTLTSLFYGWLFLQINDLVSLLQQYNTTEDSDLVAAYAGIVPGYAGADARVRHRIQVARFLNVFGYTFGWTGLQEVIAPVFTPPENARTLLAIFSDFAADSDKIDKLTEDFAASGVIAGAEPLTMADVRNFFWLQRSETMAATLKAGIDAEKANPGSQPYGLVKRALDAADALPKPMRHVAREFYASVREEDRSYFSPFIRAHPKFEKLRQQNTKDGAPPITLVPLEYNEGELVVWTLPSNAQYAELVKRFQNIAAFNELIYTWETLESGGELLPSPNLTSIAQRPWNEWLRAFNHALNKQYPWLETADPAQRAESRQFYDEELKAADAAHEKLRTDFLAQQEKTTALLREASIIDRVKKSEELVKLIGEYDRYDQFSIAAESKKLIYEIPSIVLEEIADAIYLTGPQSDQPLHQAVLMLELADAIAENFQDSPRLDVMVGYLGLIDPAIDYARNQPALLTPLLTATERSGDWLTKRVEKLEGLSRLFHALEREQQLEYGLRGVVNGDEKYLVDVDGGYVIRKGETFTIDGITYTIVDIKRNFVYHPRHGTEAPVLDDGNGTPMGMSEQLVELRYGDSTKSKTLRGSDETFMSELSMAVSLEATVRQLNDLAVFMQGAAELTMDLVELIPGAGQAVMASRLAISILQFVASDEFAILVDYVTNHPVEALEKFGKEIFALLNPGILWEFLFFGNNAFDQLRTTKTPPKHAKVPRTLSEKLTRVIMRLYNFGAGVLGSLGRLQTHTRWKSEQLQIFVLGHPAMAWVVHLVADNIDYLAALVGEAAEVGGNIDEYRKQASKALEEWPDRVFETVNALRHLELPDEIIPMSDIVEIIITMVLKRLPLKFRVAADVIMFLLDRFGKRQALMDTIADGVTSIGVDPNIPWRAVRDEYFQKPFKQARNDLASSIFEVFGKIPATVNTGIAGQFSLVTPEQQKRFQDAAAAAKVDDDFEIKTVPADVWGFTGGNAIRNRKPLAVPRSPGAPLPRSLRRPAEIGFGRNFSHVRLHRDAASARFTRSVGAQALAGGSHIFLSPQVNPSTSSGRWIVNHELAHVAQQTPRSRAAGQPAPVPRGRGLVHDPSAERSASLAADAVTRSRPRPCDPGSSPAAGFRPFGLVDVTRRLLDTLAGTADIEHDEKQEEHTGSGTGAKKLPANVKTQIDKLWSTFAKALENKTTFKSPFGHMKTQLIDHLTNKADPEKPAKAIEEALGDLALDSLRDVKTPAKGKEPAKVTQELDHKRLEIALSRFVFAKAGVLIKFELLSGIFSAAPGQEKDEPPTFQSLHVVYIHLPEIHGNSRLWQDAIGTVLGSKPRDKYLPRIRSYLEGKGPSVGIWDSTAYQLNASVIVAVDAIIAASQAGMLDKSLLPPPGEYLSPTQPASSANNIGLRLGTYSDAQQQGPERESHHITQYLLLEYFHNKCSDHKPFPLLENSATAYPGLKASGSGGDAKANTLSAPAAPKTVDLMGWEDGRGGKMPAILLATPTHRSGRLHVTTKADDWSSGGAKGSAPDSPASVVNMKFRAHLNAVDPGYLKAQDKSQGVGASAVQETFAAYVKRKNAAQPGAVQNTIYTAMQKTYHWMRDFMQPRLEDALVTIEMKYYNDLGKDHKYEIGETQLKAVFAEAVIKNKTEMEKGGWF
jgi:hypothetical protein